MSINPSDAPKQVGLKKFATNVSPGNAAGFTHCALENCQKQRNVKINK